MSGQVIQPEKVLVIMAHPDDPEFSAGGSIAKWSGSGTQIVYVIVSDGSKGSDNPDTKPEELIEQRANEQRAAAAELGVQDVAFLGYPDGLIYNSEALRREMVRRIRQHRPDLVVTHDPNFRFSANRINHPDHYIVGEAALNAVFPLSRDRLSFPELLMEGLQPHRVLHVLLAMSDRTNAIIDISGTFRRKMQALAHHKSQIADFPSLEERLKDTFRKNAEGTEFEYAERFFHISLSR